MACESADAQESAIGRLTDAISRLNDTLNPEHAPESSNDLSTDNRKPTFTQCDPAVLKACEREPTIFQFSSAELSQNRFSTSCGEMAASDKQPAADTALDSPRSGKLPATSPETFVRTLSDLHVDPPLLDVGPQVVDLQTVRDVRAILEEPRKALSKDMLSIIVLGASADDAQRKTYPTLMKLFLNHNLPPWVSIVGYAGFASQIEEFRAKLRPWLLDTVPDGGKVDAFLCRCTYVNGSYDSFDDFVRLNEHLNLLEKDDNFKVRQVVKSGVVNRLFYFAIPRDDVLSSINHIAESVTTDKGFNRLVLEAPIAHDLRSARSFVAGLGMSFSEECIYCIDDYLSKELVQNLYKFKFGNAPLQPFLNSFHVEGVEITFKEACGTEAYGGYFAKQGIIREVIQNTLMQVLCILAMELPPKDSDLSIRDAKNKLLSCIAPIDPGEVVLGQYVAADGKAGYLDDDTIRNKKRAKIVPTFAAIVLRINNSRWAGVPFVLKAGKALDESKVEVRIQYKDSMVIKHLFSGQCSGNTLSVQLLPEMSLSARTKLAEPGRATATTQSEANVSGKLQNQDCQRLDAYGRLLLETLRGRQAIFADVGEVLNSWKIFDPLLVALEKLLEREKRVPAPYRYGSSGPPAAQRLFASCSYLQHQKSSLVRQSSAQERRRASALVVRQTSAREPHRSRAPRSGSTAPATPYGSTPATSVPSSPKTSVPSSPKTSVPSSPTAGYRATAVAAGTAGPQHRSPRANALRGVSRYAEPSDSVVAAVVAFDNSNQHIVFPHKATPPCQVEPGEVQKAGLVGASDSILEVETQLASPARLVARVVQDDPGGAREVESPIDAPSQNAFQPRSRMEGGQALRQSQNVTRSPHAIRGDRGRVNDTSAPASPSRGGRGRKNDTSAPASPSQGDRGRTNGIAAQAYPTLRLRPVLYKPLGRTR